MRAAAGPRCPARTQVTACVLLLFAIAPALGADQLSPQNSAATAPRPQIALVLSGGGALGFAHIGVLLWLEEHRIPLSYLAGTSMGGVIAGLYATGVQPDLMRRLAESTDWNEMLRSDIPFEDLPFRRKRDRRDTHDAPEIGLRGGINAPAGLTPAPLVDLFLSRLTLAHSDVPAFDSFPIPFRCVAADLVTGATVVLRDGPVSEALRATMAMPGVFTPVKRSRQTLVDGVLVNPLPTDVVTAMGADTIVAIDIVTPREFGSPVRVLERSIDVAASDTRSRNLRLADIVIAIEVQDYSFTDLNAAAELIRIGYDAAGKQEAALVAFGLSEGGWQMYLSERQARQRQAVDSPSFIDVEGTLPADRAVAERRLRRHQGRPLNVDRWHRDLSRIVGSGPYERARYQQVDRAGQRGLKAVFVPKEHGPPFVMPGLDIDASEVHNTRFNVKARVVMLTAAEAAEWRADVSLGFRNGVAATYHYPVGARGWFVAPRAFFDRQRQFLYAHGARAGEFLIVDAGASIDVGHEIGAASELRLGYELRRQDAGADDTGDHQLDADGLVNLLRFAWAFNNQNDASLPDRGLRVAAATDWFLDVPGGSNTLPRAAAEWSFYASPLERHVWFVAARAATAFGRSSPFAQQFTLGGPLRLSAYPLDAFRGDDALYGAVGYLRELAEGAPLPVPGLLGPLKLGAWYEVGTTSGGPDDRARHDVTGGLVAKTRLGVFFLGASWGEKDNRRAYFTLGQFF